MRKHWNIFNREWPYLIRKKKIHKLWFDENHKNWKWTNKIVILEITIPILAVVYIRQIKRQIKIRPISSSIII